MALSYVEWTANGADTDFAVSFPFINRTHVKVFDNGALTSAFTWLSDGMIRMNVAPVLGHKVLIKRETPYDKRLETFSGHQGILPKEVINANSLQLFNIFQEREDWSANMSGFSGELDLGNKRLTNVGAPSAPADMATKGFVDSAFSGIASAVNLVFAGIATRLKATADTLYSDLLALIPGVFGSWRVAATIKMPTNFVRGGGKLLSAIKYSYNLPPGTTGLYVGSPAKPWQIVGRMPHSCVALHWSEADSIWIGAFRGLKNQDFILSTSPDGNVWTQRWIDESLGYPVNKCSIASKAGVIVVRRDYYVIHSSDAGISWIQRDSGIYGYNARVALNETTGVFIMMGDSGAFKTAPDGITWSADGVARVPNAPGDFEGMWAIGGSIYTLYSNGMWKTTNDGATWARISSTSLTAYLDRIWVFGGKFWRSSGNTARPSCSTDGITWTAPGGTAAVAQYDMYDDDVGNLYVTTADPAVPIQVSHDQGVTWAPLTGLPARPSLTTGTFLAFSRIGNTIIGLSEKGVCARSIDSAKSWTYTQADLSGQVTQALANNGSLFVSGSNAGLIQTSPDGVVWTPRVSGTSKPIHDIVWNGVNFLAVAYAAGATDYLESADGITWIKHTSTRSTNSRVCYAFGAWWAGENTSGQIYKSIDNGANWTLVTTLALLACGIGCVAFNGTTMIVTPIGAAEPPGSGLHIYSTTDGINFTAHAHNLGGLHALRNALWHNGVWYIAASQWPPTAYLIASADLDTWVKLAGETHGITYFPGAVFTATGGLVTHWQNAFMLSLAPDNPPVSLI